MTTSTSRGETEHPEARREIRIEFANKTVNELADKMREKMKGGVITRLSRFVTDKVVMPVRTKRSYRDIDLSRSNGAFYETRGSNLTFTWDKQIKPTAIKLEEGETIQVKGNFYEEQTVSGSQKGVSIPGLSTLSQLQFLELRAVNGNGDSRFLYYITPSHELGLEPGVSARSPDTGRLTPVESFSDEWIDVIFELSSLTEHAFD